MATQKETNKNTLQQKLVSLVSSIEKQFGQGAIMQLEHNKAQGIAVIPAGCISLDRALGCGGYPKGRVVEIFGPESSGKTTLSLHAIAECQKQGGIAAFIDAEHALDVAYAKKLSVNTEQLLVSQPDTGEQALDIVETLVRSESVDLIVVDSVAALVPKAEIEGDMGDSHMGLQARLMSQALRKLTAITHRTGTIIVFINQLRSKIGVMFGSPETTTGGQALKYYASLRVDVRRIGQVKTGDEVTGSRTRVKIVKNKLAPPFQTAEFDIRYGTGIDVLGDIIDLSVEMGLLEKSGAYLSFEGQSLGQGREKARAYLLEHASLAEKLRGVLLHGKTPEQKQDERAEAPKAA